MIPAEVVKQRSFTTACGVFLFSYAALTAVYFYLTLLYQDVDGWSALRTGLSWLFLNVPFLVVAQLAGRLNRRLSPRAVVAGGCLLTAAAVITLSTLTRSSPFPVTVIGYVLFGAGTGMWIPGVANVAMRDVPPGLSGTASGVFNASRQVGTSIGLAILGAIGADTARSAWNSHVSHLSGAARQAATAQAHNVASAQIGPVTKALGPGQRAAAEHAFSDGYEVGPVGRRCSTSSLVLAARGQIEVRTLSSPPQASHVNLRLMFHRSWPRCMWPGLVWASCSAAPPMPISSKTT